MKLETEGFSAVTRNKFKWFVRKLNVTHGEISAAGIIYRNDKGIIVAQKVADKYFVRLKP